MISDLKEDSRRWANERTHLEQRYGYGQGSPIRDPLKARKPDTAIAPSYLSSNIHDERQQLGPTPGPMQPSGMTGGPQYGQPYGAAQGGMNPPQYGAQQQPPMQDNYGQSYIYTSGPPSVTYPQSTVSSYSYDSGYQTAPRTTNPHTTSPYGDAANPYGSDTTDYQSTGTGGYYPATPGTTTGGTPQVYSTMQQQPPQQQQGYPPRDPVGYTSDPRASTANRHDTSSRDTHRRDQGRRR
jgi:hypothetical protein